MAGVCWSLITANQVGQGREFPNRAALIRIRDADMDVPEVVTSSEREKPQGADPPQRPDVPVGS